MMVLGDLRPPLYELDLDSAVSGFMSLNAVFKTAVTSYYLEYYQFVSGLL